MDNFLCADSSVTIFAQDFPGFDLTWNTGSQADSIVISTQGNYWMTLHYESCQVDYPFSITAVDNPDLTLSRNGNFCVDDVIAGDSYFITASSEGHVIWDNYPGADSTLQIFAEGTYVASATNEYGCSISESISIPSYCLPKIYIPNAFTPDGDGINDNWNVSLTGNFNTFEARIHDRWGAVVYESTDPTDIWNGSVNDGEYFAQDGVYQYYVTVHYSGENNNVIVENLNGFVTIIEGIQKSVSK